MIAGTVHIPRGASRARIGAKRARRETTVVLTCASGTRSVLSHPAAYRAGLCQRQLARGRLTGWKARGDAVGADDLAQAYQETRLLATTAAARGRHRPASSRCGAKVWCIGAGGLFLGSPSRMRYSLPPGWDDRRGPMTTWSTPRTCAPDFLHGTDRVVMVKSRAPRHASRAQRRCGSTSIARGSRRTRDRVIAPRRDHRRCGQLRDALPGQPTPRCGSEARATSVASFRFEGQITVFQAPARLDIAYYSQAPPPRTRRRAYEARRVRAAGIMGV